MRQLFQTENIRILTSSRIAKILGDQRIAGLVLEGLALHRQQLDADGLFIAIGRKPNTDFLPDCLSRAADGAILADEAMRTNLPGVFAAGDLRRKNCRQVITAAADGAIAAISAGEYLKKT